MIIPKGRFPIPAGSISARRIEAGSPNQQVAMTPEARARYETRARIIKALAHPARLLIVDQLAKGREKCVCELTEMIGTDMSTVSRHLTQLKQAGLIADEKRGQMVFYRLRAGCVPDFFDCLESVMRCNAAEQRNLAREGS